MLSAQHRAGLHASVANVAVPRSLQNKLPGVAQHDLLVEHRNLLCVNLVAPSPYTRLH